MYSTIWRYKEQKKILDAALGWQRDVHGVICEQAE
jgi:hypothetical protein